MQMDGIKGEQSTKWEIVTLVKGIASVAALSRTQTKYSDQTNAEPST